MKEVHGLAYDARAYRRRGKALDVLLIALASFVVGAVASGVYGAHEIRALKEYSAGVERTALLYSDRADSLTVRTARLEDSLARAKRPLVVRARVDSSLAARADSAVAAARTATDSAATLVVEVRELKDENAALRGTIALDSLEFLAEKQRGDSLADYVAKDSVLIAHLNAHVQDLLAPRMPKWLSVSLEAAKDVGLVYGGVQWGKAIARK